jgi:hypothetical protein
LPLAQFFCSADALVMPLFPVLMMALTLVASVRTIQTGRSTAAILWSEEFPITTIMGDTISSGIRSAQVILQLAMPSADSMEAVDSTVVAVATAAVGTGRLGEMTDDK